MIARARTEIGLRVTFHRDDLLIDSAVVPTGEDARDEALLIIARQDALQVGDRLAVVDATGPAERPPSIGSPP